MSSIVMSSVFIVWRVFSRRTFVFAWESFLSALIALLALCSWKVPMAALIIRSVRITKESVPSPLIKERKATPRST